MNCPLGMSFPVLNFKRYYAKSLQSCPTLCDPINGSPPGSPVPGILQARILEWVAIAFSGKAKIYLIFPTALPTLSLTHTHTHIDTHTHTPANQPVCVPLLKAKGGSSPGTS